MDGWMDGWVIRFGWMDEWTGWPNLWWEEGREVARGDGRMDRLMDR